MTRRTAIALLFGALVCASCTKTDGPLDPVWGKQPCAHCAMLVSDKRFAAQLIAPDGERKFFDDIGCMVLFMDKRNLATAPSWVRSAAGAWVDARGAKYRPGAASPMDFGFEPSAGDGVAWNELRERVQRKEREGR